MRCRCLEPLCNKLDIVSILDFRLCNFRPKTYRNTHSGEFGDGKYDVCLKPKLEITPVQVD